MGALVTALVFGNIDIPYAYDQEQLSKKGKVLKKKKKVTKAITTGDVAAILEDHYQIYETFFELNKQTIGSELAKSYVGAFHRLHATGVAADPGMAAMSDIEAKFKQFLTDRVMETQQLVTASAHSSRQVPTQAALDGVNHRLAHPYAKSNPRRPSFVDTGLYSATSKVWLK